MDNYNSRKNIMARITGDTSNYSMDNSLKRILGKNYDSYNKTRKKTNEKTQMEEPINYYAESTMNNTTEKADSGYLNKNNAFSDGYQFGDVAKTLFATVDDIGTNLTKGVYSIVEGAGDLASYGAAKVLDWVGQDEMSNQIKEFAKRNMVEELHADDLTWTNVNPITAIPNRIMGIKDIASGKAKTTGDYINNLLGLSDSYNDFIHDTKEKYSLTGDKSDAVAQGLGYYAGMVALQSVGVPWQVTAGVTSMGNNLSESYNEGATDGEAWTYAAISSLAEVGSEYLFSGLGKLKGTGALDDAVVGNLTKKLKNGIIKNVAQYGLKSAGEGVEEIASGLASNIAKKITYKKDGEKSTFENVLDGGKEYFNTDSPEGIVKGFFSSDAWNDFSVGTIVSAISGGNDIIKANKSGRNYMTGLTTNESKVVDSEVKTRLETELNKLENKNLTNNQKNSLETKIREQVTSDLQQGKIDINKVNEIVGEDNVVYDGKKKDTYLINSKINEQQKSRDFEYVKSGNEKVDSMLQSLTNAGANNTIQTHDMARLGTKLVNDLGIEVQFTSNESIDNIEGLSPERKAEIKKLISEGKTVNGFKDNGKLYINLNSSEAGSFVFGHETTHFFESDTKTYNTLKDTLINYAKTKGTYDTDIADLERLYKGVEGANIESELIANYIGQNFTNQEFVDSLTSNPSTFTKIYNYVKEMFYKATGQTEKAQLQKIKNTFDKAYRNYAKNNNVEEGTKLSISDNQLSPQEKIDTRKSISDNESKQSALFPTLDNTKLSDSIKTEENLPVAEAEEVKTPDNEVVTEEPKKESVKESNVIVNNSMNKQSIKTTEIATKEMKKYTNLKGDEKVSFEQAIKPFTTMTQEELLQNGNYDKVKEIVEQYSDTEIEFTDEDIKKVKNEIRNKQIKVTEDLKNQITDYNYFRKSNFGKLRLSNEGTYIDVLWNELVNEYPHYFSNEILAESDMLYALSDFMNEDNSITNTEFLSDNQIDELTNNVFGEILDNSITNKQLEELKQKDIELSNQKQNEINEVVKSYTGTQEEYLSTKAQELYDEISNLKKGVKASKELGVLLDTGAKWSDIKAALSNVKWKPEQVVDKNFEIEGIIRQELTNMYDSKVKEFAFNENSISNPNNMTAEEIVKMKRYNYLKSLNDVKNDMNTTIESINARIESKQAEYDSKSDNTTLTAQNLLKQISDLNIRKSNIELEYNNRINKLEDKISKFDVKEETRKISRQEAVKRNMDLAEEKLGDLSQYKDKKRGISYKLNTQKRNLYDITSKENATELYETYFRPITEGAAESERIKTKYKQQFADMKITPEESTYIQMLGELRSNPDTTLTKEIVETYYKANEKKIDANKVDNAIELARQNYDELFALDNEVRERNGYKPIEYRKGYFPHFVEEKAQSKIGKLAEKFGWKIKSGSLPTSIAGITDIFRPGKIYSPFDNHRTGDTTDYDFLKGFDMYVDYVADNVTQMDNIQKLRALETTIRKQYSEEGIKQSIEEILADENIDNESKYDSIDALVKNAQDNPLSNWVTDLRNYTDGLANKKAFMDRSMEQSFGRQTYSIINNVMGRVSANMVGGNIASALTNFIPITQGFSQFGFKNGMKATKDFIKSCIKDDGLADKSTLLTNRTRQAEKLSQTTLDKVSSVMTKPFEFIDEISSNILVRAKMYENLDNGMPETEALKNADEFAKDVMGGRAKGDAPTIMNVKNPFVKVFTAFQLEVNNQYGYMFKDVPRDIGDEAKEKLVGAFFKMFLAAFLYNQLDEKITGRKSAFSPIDIAIDEMKVATNENLSLGEKISNIGTDVAKQLPFVGGVMGGGRLPIQGAIPFNNPLEMVTKTLEETTKLFDSDPAKKEKALNELKKEWSKPIFYLGLPFGGGQLKKTIEGTSMYNDNLPIKGSYTTSNQLRFEADDSALGKLQAAVFGQYANKNAREYFDKGYKPLTEKQIEEVMESELGVSEYRKIKEGLKKKSNNEDKIDYIYNLPLADNQKNVLANNILNRKEEIDISNYGDYGSLEEFDYANKNPEKYSTITQITDYNTYNQYKDEIANIKKEYTDTDERKNAVFDYIDSLDMNMYQKTMLYKMAGGYSIKSYANEMFDYIDSLEMTAEEKQTIYDELFK